MAEGSDVRMAAAQPFVGGVQSLQSGRGNRLKKVPEIHSFLNYRELLRGKNNLEAQSMSVSANNLPTNESGIALVSAEQRPDLIPAFAELSTPVWPKFLGGDEAIIQCWHTLFAEGLTQYQFAVLRSDTEGHEQVLGTSNAIPFVWQQFDDDSSLPNEGLDAVLLDGVDARASGRKANAISALSIVVSSEMRGSDLAERLLLNMKACARREGFKALVAPVRPTRKATYPLTSFHDYMAWTTANGAPFDPWVRKHWQLGARLVKIAPRSMRVSAPLAQWSEWSGLRFPVTGPYHVDGGLVPMIADCATGLGLYEEPNIWMRHPLA